MRKTFLFFFVLIASCLFITTCGNTPASSAGQAAFFNSAKQTAPTITATLTSSVKANVLTWANGNIMYELFGILRDYDSTNPSSSIGLENVYSLLYTASMKYDDSASKCTTITSQVVASPFNFGNSVTYNCAGNETANNLAYAFDKSVATSQKAILSFMATAPGGTEYTVMQGSHDDSTKIVNVDMATYVDYTATNDYSLRVYLTGNEETHTFTLKLMKYNGSGYWISVAGYGISKGAGNYFLFKVKDAENLAGATKYFCFKSDSTESTLRDLATYLGSDTVDANCAAYQTAVDALTLFTSSDVPTALSSFTNSSIFVTYQ